MPDEHERRAEALRRRIKEIKADIRAAEDEELYDEADALQHDLATAENELYELEKHDG